MTQITVVNATARALGEALADAGIPPPTSLQPDSALRQTTITWTPDLTAPQLQALATLQQLALGAGLLTLAERNALQNDIDGLITFQGLATPTLAQTVAAVKAQSRVLRAILRS